MNHPDDILSMLRQVKYDLSVTQTRIDEAIRAVGALPFPPKVQIACPSCRLNHFRSERSLAEHVYNHHAGPVPEHYLAVERLAGFVPVEGDAA